MIRRIPFWIFLGFLLFLGACSWESHSEEALRSYSLDQRSLSVWSALTSSTVTWDWYIKIERLEPDPGTTDSLFMVQLERDGTYAYRCKIKQGGDTAVTELEVNAIMYQLFNDMEFYFANELKGGIKEKRRLTKCIEVFEGSFLPKLKRVVATPEDLKHFTPPASNLQ